MPWCSSPRWQWWSGPKHWSSFAGYGENEKKLRVQPLYHTGVTCYGINLLFFDNFKVKLFGPKSVENHLTTEKSTIIKCNVKRIAWTERAREDGQFSEWGERACRKVETWWNSWRSGELFMMSTVLGLQGLLLPVLPPVHAKHLNQCKFIKDFNRPSNETWQE